MAFERISNNFNRLNDSIKAYMESSAEYVKLELFSKGMKGAIGLVNGLIMAFLGIFTLIFLSVAVSVWLSNEIGVPSSGFFIVGGFYLLLLLFMIFIGRKMVERNMLVKVSRKVFNETEVEDKKRKQDEAV